MLEEMMFWSSIGHRHKYFVDNGLISIDRIFLLTQQLAEHIQPLNKRTINDWTIWLG
jgi:hypothetical protein